MDHVTSYDDAHGQDSVEFQVEPQFGRAAQMLYISQKLLMLPSVENVDVKFRKRVRRTDFLIRNRSVFQTTRFGREVPRCPSVRQKQVTPHYFARARHAVACSRSSCGVAPRMYMCMHGARHCKTHGTHMHQCTSRTYTIARHTHTKIVFNVVRRQSLDPVLLQMGFGGLIESVGYICWKVILVCDCDRYRHCRYVGLVSVSSSSCRVANNVLRDSFAIA